MPLLQLPEDVLILVLEQCTILDLLNCRVTSIYLRNIITQYGTSIFPASAATTIDAVENSRLYSSIGTVNNLTLLKGLIPKYLAASILNGPSFSFTKSLGWSSISINDVEGDHLRSRLENGFRIVKRLSSCARTIYSPPVMRSNAFNQSTLANIQATLNQRLSLGGKGKASNAQDSSFIAKKEQMVYTRRLEIVHALTSSDAADYLLTMRLLSKAIRFHPRFRSDGTPTLKRQCDANGKELKETTVYDWPGKVEGKYSWVAATNVDMPRPLPAWIIWFILHIGPDAFFRQWTSSYDDKSEAGPDHVAHFAWRLWSTQSPRTIATRAQLAMDIDLELCKKCLKQSRRRSVAENGKNAAEVERQTQLLAEAIQRATTDHKLFVDEALLSNYFLQWRAAGGTNRTVGEEVEEQDQKMLNLGRHPREMVPFFVYLGREVVEEIEE